MAKPVIIEARKAQALRDLAAANAENTRLLRLICAHLQIDPDNPLPVEAKAEKPAGKSKK